LTKLLALVQSCAREQTARYTGTVQEVLIEEVNDHKPGYVTGRMSNNLLVHFPGEASQIGQYINVSLDECKGFISWELSFKGESLWRTDAAV